MHRLFTSEFAAGGTLHKQIRPAGRLSGAEGKEGTNTMRKHSTSDTDQQWFGADKASPFPQEQIINHKKQHINSESARERMDFAVF